MDRTAIEQAASLFVEARRTGNLLDALPESCRPADVRDAHQIQQATVVALGESVAGWKVGSPIEGTIVRGALLASRVLRSGSAIAARQVPLLGLEAEIAFRFERDLPPRGNAYSRDEVARAVVAFPAIEIVDSRFRDYRGTPLVQRIADCVSNGAFVAGDPVENWRDHDLEQIAVRLEIDGTPVVDRTGGHPTGDPLLPAIELVNDLRHTSGVRAGQLMTTGTYTGIHFARPGQSATAVFDRFGRAEVRLEA